MLDWRGMTTARLCRLAWRVEKIQSVACYNNLVVPGRQAIVKAPRGLPQAWGSTRRTGEGVIVDNHVRREWNEKHSPLSGAGFRRTNDAINRGHPQLILRFLAFANELLLRGYWTVGKALRCQRLSLPRNKD